MNSNFSSPDQKLLVYRYATSDEPKFQQINLQSFRSPLKARGFYLVCPETFTPINGLIYPSYLKVFDTIYARTIRNKFKATFKGNDIATYTGLDPRSQIAEMKQIGWYLRNEALNHSDSFAGGIALRFGEGILVTASYTDKYQIESDRVCYVEKYIPEENEVYVVGNFPPSSESALSYLAFQEFPSSNLILHFHDKRMTCNPKLNHYRTSGYNSYGEPAEAIAVVDKLKETHNFAIAYGHGEFVLSSSFSEAKAVIARIQDLLKT